MTAIEDTLPEVPADADRDRLAEVVAELAEMNSDDFSTFRDNGVPSRQGQDGAAAPEVRVEFAFAAPNEPVATSLADDLLAEGYEAGPSAPEGEYDEWVVRGTTPSVTVAEAGLAEWVRRLAAYGLEHDECVLDGWAAVLD